MRRMATNVHRPLNAAALRPAAPLRCLRGPVFTLDTVDSTNAFLLARAGELADGSLAVAEYQTAGRGRLGRRWEAPRGAAVLLSVLLHEPADSPLLTLAALLGAVAACEAVAAQTDCHPAVRWPNDIVLAGRKLGGVLAETRTGPEPRARALVLGVGLNCWQQHGHFAGALADKATSLETAADTPVDRAALARALVASLDRWLTSVRGTADGPAHLRDAWRAFCADLGTRITLEHDGRTWFGTLVDITDDADLIVQLDEGGRRHFAAATTTRFW